MDKKAQGLSINVIIIVAIALIVLVVLVAIFTGRLGVFSGHLASETGEPTKTCAQQNAEPKISSECKTKVIISSDSNTFEGDKVCCRKAAPVP